MAMIACLCRCVSPSLDDAFFLWLSLSQLLRGSLTLAFILMLHTLPRPCSFQSVLPYYNPPQFGCSQPPVPVCLWLWMLSSDTGSAYMLWFLEHVWFVSGWQLGCFFHFHFIHIWSSLFIWSQHLLLLIIHFNVTMWLSVIDWFIIIFYHHWMIASGVSNSLFPPFLILTLLMSII